MELDDDVDDDFILNAWKNGLKRSWKEPGGGAQRRTDLNDSFKVLADYRGSVILRSAYKWEKSVMSPDVAYNTLDVPRDVDEGMLLTVYSMRVSDRFFSWLMLVLVFRGPRLISGPMIGGGST